LLLHPLEARRDTGQLALDTITFARQADAICLQLSEAPSDELVDEPFGGLDVTGEGGRCRSLTCSKPRPVGRLALGIGRVPSLASSLAGSRLRRTHRSRIRPICA
jgi:hypothetical protein